MEDSGIEDGGDQNGDNLKNVSIKFYRRYIQKSWNEFKFVLFKNCLESESTSTC